MWSGGIILSALPVMTEATRASSILQLESMHPDMGAVARLFCQQNLKCNNWKTVYVFALRVTPYIVKNRNCKIICQWCPNDLITYWDPINQTMLDISLLGKLKGCRIKECIGWVGSLINPIL